MQEIFKLSEEEYLEICRQKYRSMNEAEQNKMALRETVAEFSKGLAESKFQGKADNERKALHIKRMTNALHSAMYVIIRCKFGITNMFFLNDKDIPEAISTVNKVANIILEGV